MKSNILLYGSNEIKEIMLVIIELIMKEML